MDPLVVYSKDGCSYCTRALAFFDKLRIPYEVRRVDASELRRVCGVAEGPLTYPQIFRGSERLGGYDDVYEIYHEPLLEENTERFTLFPIKYPEIFELYQNAVASFWTVSEIDLTHDHADWNRLEEQERRFIKHILAFFASSDSIVADNLVANFCNEIQIAESRAFLAYQAYSETVHGHTYSLLLDTYVTEDEERDRLFRAITTIEPIKKKAAWAFRFMNAQQPFSVRLIAFAIVEGVFFSGSFCSIFWLKKRGLMPGLSFSNVLIARDEGMHVDHAVALFRRLRYRPDQSLVHDLVGEAVDHEIEFITEALSCDLIGMNRSLMGEYIKYVADHMLAELGYAKIYHASNPFPFMESISLEGKTNFFEKRVGEYQKAGVRTGRAEQGFSTDADF